MTTDPAAAAAEEIARYPEERHSIARIIRRHYADQERLLRRAVTVCHEMCRDTRERDVSFDSREMFRKRKNAMIDLLRDAARLGITGDAT